MTGAAIEPERIRHLNEERVHNGGYVLYWMQQSQRAEFNHALEYAVETANELDKPLLVVFGLTEAYPEANLRHYTFMLEGLRETRKALEQKGIKLVARVGEPVDVALRPARDACVVICDMGYLRHQRAWRMKLAREARRRVVQVEADAVCPVEAVSDKSEYAARTIRPKILGLIDRYVVVPPSSIPRRSSLEMDIESLNLDDIGSALGRLSIDTSVGPVDRFFRGGTSEAKRVFDEFLAKKLSGYAKNRGRPETDYVSHMGMYLHFGQISPVYLAMRILEAENVDEEERNSYLEELIVRRELAINFVYHKHDYDAFSCLPGWAQATLRDHSKDPRNPLYTPERLEAAETHDTYWNAAMMEMKATGYMHNHMRMYWGKKVLEWSESPESAYATALAMNNKYFLDGRDPSSYANIAWIFGLHDRPWKERAIYGKIRSMTASGLERKCDVKAYVNKVERLIEQTRTIS